MSVSVNALHAIQSRYTKPVSKVANKLGAFSRRESERNTWNGYNEN